MVKMAIIAYNDLKSTNKICKTYTVPTVLLVLLFIGVCNCDVTLNSTLEIKGVPNSSVPATTEFIHSMKSSVQPLPATVPFSTGAPTTKESIKITKSFITTERSTTIRKPKTQVSASTKGLLKYARRRKPNSTSSTIGAVHSSTRLQDRLGAIDCELPVLPRESRLWRGNETHELNLPVKMSEECAGMFRRGGEEECSPVIVSWEGAADIQSGDILIVRIADSSPLDTFVRVDSTNETINTNTSHVDEDSRSHRTIPQPAVYQVTRQGHEHCDVSDGMLLDITSLDENGVKIFTLYDKDLTEGVNLLIVVSENWGAQCVRLKVTVKSDNCGDSQECTGKGVCYTNVSMEGYECQCCRGFVGPHCEDRDACNPSPCLNNGICVDLSQPLNGANYHCLCPYGFTGRKCEKDPCYSEPCINGGSCMSMAMNGSTTFHCACADGWTGSHCELEVSSSDCGGKSCVKGICGQTENEAEGQKFSCFCEPGYTGDSCDIEYNECESSPCVNGGTCTDRVNGFECACGRGYTGNTCQTKVDLCKPNPCPEHRYCLDHGNSFTCECPSGFVGDECNSAATICDNNPCAHGGTCWSGVDSFYCSCRPGYTGRICEEDFILEAVVDGESESSAESQGGGSVREMRLPLGLYHDRLHNVYIAAGTLGAAIAIVGVVVTACHCRVNKTYSRLLSRLSRVTEPGPPHHWLQDKRAAQAPFQPPAALDTTDMYYTLDFSDSQSSPLIQ